VNGSAFAKSADLPLGAFSMQPEISTKGRARERPLLVAQHRPPAFVGILTGNARRSTWHALWEPNPRDGDYTTRGI
jgi:hypothetical protein